MSSPAPVRTGHEAGIGEEIGGRGEGEERRRDVSYGSWVWPRSQTAKARRGREGSRETMKERERQMLTVTIVNSLALPPVHQRL
jgi:hypothetical protein